MPGGYVVRDANGQALVYVYSRDSEAEAMQAKVLTKDEPRRIAVNVAKLPCPHCGQRMAITIIEPTPLAYGAASSDLEDITHGCAQCRTALTGTMHSRRRAS
jgi:hypothetical protein